ncbi:MAG: ATP-binding protein, partial [Thermodesulfobacteriota bacterium]|nr:ATP-binding protein [Thermodesulfobacteriota bacterium]
IVTQFLDYAKGSKPEWQKVDINKAIENTLLLIDHRIIQQKITLKKVFAPLPLISCDPERIAQLFLNVFLNALDAMGNEEKLEIVTKNTDGFVQIKIKDSGSGIPESIKARIFQPFVTTKPKGLGLGLAIVHRIVEEHKGTIKVHTKLQKGTIFTISLPLETKKD